MKENYKNTKRILLFFSILLLLVCTSNTVLAKENTEAVLKLTKNAQESKITITLSNMDFLKEKETITYCVWNDIAKEASKRWYQGGKNANYKRTIAIKNHKYGAGTYHVEAYVKESNGQKTLLAKKKIVIQDIDEGKVSFEKVNHQDGTCRVRLKDFTSPAAITKVKVLVWSKKNHGDDKQWYTAKKQGKNWYIEFNTENHDFTSGLYYFQPKVWDARGVVKTFKEKSKTIRVNTTVTTSLKANKSQSKYTAAISNVRYVMPVDKVEIAVWSKSSGSKSKCYYKAKDKGNGVYQATIDIGNHKDSGTYYAYTYVTIGGEGRKLVNKQTFSVKGITGTKVSYNYENKEKGSVQVNITNITSPAEIEKVEVAAYTKKKGKDDVVTKEALVAGNGYKSTISVAEHDFWQGTYYIDITITDKRGIVKKLSTKSRDLSYTDTYKNKTSFQGIDVSRYQGNIDWTQVKAAGIDFVMIQVGYRNGVYGNIAEDIYFERNIQGALNAGIDVGVYFFSQAITEEEAREEAAWAVKKVSPYKITYPICIDSEYRKNGRANSLSAAVRTAVVNAFCKEVQDSGYTPMIYASKSWFENNLYMNSLAGYEVWLARYHVVPEYTGPFQIWQYSNKGHVPGIQGYVDRDLGYKRYY